MMRTTLTAATLALSALLLAGCVTGTVKPALTASAASGGIGAGAAIPQDNAALALFDTVCIQTNVDPGQARAAMGQLPFRLNTASNVYYHRDLNLSFFLGQGAEGPFCSIITASQGDPQNLARKFRAFAARRQTEALVIVSRQSDGNLYVNAVAFPKR